MPTNRCFGLASGPRSGRRPLPGSDSPNCTARCGEVLREAIALGGSSISDYVDADGEDLFQLQHRVDGREGEPCLVRGYVIRRIGAGSAQEPLGPGMSKTAWGETISYVDGSNPTPDKGWARGPFVSADQVIIMNKNFRSEWTAAACPCVLLPWMSKAHWSSKSLWILVFPGVAIMSLWISAVPSSVWWRSRIVRSAAGNRRIGVPGIIDMETGLVRETPISASVHYPARAAIEEVDEDHRDPRKRRQCSRRREKNAWECARIMLRWPCCNLGTGVGCGLVLGGRDPGTARTAWPGSRGHHGRAGTVIRRPGNLGRLEEYASATATDRMAWGKVIGE